LFAGFKQLDKATKRLLAVGFLFALARFSEAFLILKGIEIGLSEALSPLTLALFNLAYVVLAYPAGSLSDRMSPRSILMAGMAVLVAGDLVLAKADNYAMLAAGVALWGAHMALTQGIFSRMIADSAPEQMRATSFGAFWFVSGIAGLLASLGAGWLWDRDGSSATFLTSAAVAAVALAMLSLLQEDSSSLRRRRGEGDQP
jgi:MFS family permease